MYHGGVSKRKVNPKQNAGIPSLITFFFTRSLLTQGFKKDIEEDDIYDIIEDFQSEELGNQLEKQWEIETQQNKPSVYRLLWACYGKYYLFWGFVQLIMKTATVMIQPWALGKFIYYFTNPKDMTKEEAVYFAALLIGWNIINCTYSHNYMFIITELGIKIRTAFCSLMYRKSLALSLSAMTDITIGKIVTLISKDVQNFETAIIFLNDMWISVIQLIITTYLIYRRIGVATFAGIGFLILVIPLQLFIGRLTSRLRLAAAKKTDDRVQVTQETLSAIKIIKMYTWEKYFGEKISNARQEEIDKIKKIYYSKAISLIVGLLVLNITLYIIIMTYYISGNVLTAEVIFFILSCLQNIRSTVTVSIPLGISQTAELVASIKRIDNVLRAQTVRSKERRTDVLKPLIILENISAVIKDSIILNGVNLKILTPGLYSLTGRLGGGKSFLLKVILEDYPVSQGTVRVEGKLSYASEEPWLFPSSIRQNILFGETFNKERYQRVLDVSALTQDINTFDRGDETIVDDRGMNLSKGQQSRINLARAIYRDADIYLLDDCLSSLDAHVQEYVFKEGIKKFLHNKVVIMISQNEKFIKEGNKVIIMENGKITSYLDPEQIAEEEIIDIVRDDEKPIEDDIIDNIKLVETVPEDDTEDTKLIETVDKPSNANIYHEDKKEGNVDIDVYKQYFKFGGGYLLLCFVVLLFIVSQIGMSYTQKLVSNWANIQQNLSEYKTNNVTIDTKYYELLQQNKSLLTIYTITIVASTLLVLARAYAHFNLSSRASVRLHKAMILSLINATMGFFDLHYIGNILNRFSKDLGTIDEYLPFVLYECLRLIYALTGIIALIATVNKYFLILAGLMFIILYLIRRFYIPTGRSLKRLDSAMRSPVIGHLNASLEGLTTIRAYNTEQILGREFDKHQDLYTSVYYMLQCALRAFAYSMDMLCNLFVAIIVITFLVIGKTTLAGEVGLAITQAFMLTGLLQWGIRQWAELENQMTSVERVLEYSDASEESNAGQVIENWPEYGKIVYNNVNLTYHKTKENVLKNINFVIQPKEKIGIVGRTGAGKSSIISTLFRLYESDGLITIDEIDVKMLSLNLLRSSIAIIPQDPVLFTGTIRSNIDPTNKYSDKEIWKAIEATNLKSLVENLDLKITESGSNYSSGQRQLICLARAAVSKNKIIILDEATANMDTETEALIQQSIKESFAGCTVLTIAHRLHSVLYSDKVMVVDKGQIVEFAAPKTLLEKEEGVFYKMVKQANLLK